MKIKDREHPFQCWGGVMSGCYDVVFNKTETFEALEKTRLKLMELIKKYSNSNSNLNFNFDLNFYRNRSYLHWSRSYNEDEKKKVRIARKIQKLKQKEVEAKNFKKHAKQLGLKVVKI